MTRAELEARTRKELAALAKQYGVPGWHPMKKAELVRALLKLSVARESQCRRPGRRLTTCRADGAAQTAHETTPRKNGNGGSKNTNGRSSTRAAQVPRGNNGRCSDTAATPDHNGLRPGPDSTGSRNGKHSDRLIVRVCTPHWLHAQWHLSHASIARAEVALGIEWYRAKPIIRVLEVASEDKVTNATRWIRDVAVAGPTDSWCVPVDDVGHTYQLQLGYLAASGQFFILARSTSVRTGTMGAFSEAVSGHGVPAERDGRSPRGKGISGTSRFVNGVADGPSSREWQFGGDHNIGGDSASEDCGLELNAEITVRGKTRPGCRVTLLGKRVAVSDDGTFEVRLKLSDGRQVIPAVAVSPDGRETQTVVLAIEHKTKALEPRIAGQDFAWS